MKASLLRSVAARPRAARLVSLAVVLLAAPVANATVFTFDIQGRAGFGLLGGNENHVVNGTPGTGGEGLGGVFYDDVTNRITVDIRWGVTNGFTNLTGTATAAHIHSSASNSATGIAAFDFNGPVVVALDNLPTYTFNTSATGGFVTGFSILTDVLETALFAGQLYFNVHTAVNGPGEIRGNLVNATAIPEPSAFAAIGGVAVLGLAASRRRRAV